MLDGGTGLCPRAGIGARRLKAFFDRGIVTGCSVDVEHTQLAIRPVLICSVTGSQLKSAPIQRLRRL
jgi:hypothetical protein